MTTESSDTNCDLTTVSPQASAIAEETSLPEVHLPEPDPENITVLTQNLPNTPILPWNQYDSPWNEVSEEEPGAATDTGEAIAESNNSAQLERDREESVNSGQDSAARVDNSPS